MADPDPPANQRRSPRHEVVCKVEILPAGAPPRSALARDLSNTGVLLGTSENVSPGTPVKLSIPLERGRSALVRGKVIWSGRDPDATEPLYLAGVEFEELPPAIAGLVQSPFVRRKARRHRIEKTVTLCLPEGARSAVTQDVSETGARLTTTWRPEVGEVVILRPPHGDADASEPLTGDVVWVNQVTDEHDRAHGLYEIGVRLHQPCDVGITFELGEFDD